MPVAATLAFAIALYVVPAVLCAANRRLLRRPAYVAAISRIYDAATVARRMAVVLIVVLVFGYVLSNMAIAVRIVG